MTKVIAMTRKGALANGALVAYLAPKLAQDAKVDLAPHLVALTHANFPAKKKSIVEGIRSATRGKLAQDASIDDITELLDALEGVEVAEGADTDPNTGLPVPMKKEEGQDAEPSFEKGREFLKGKLSAEDMKACDELMGYKDKPAGDESEEDKKKREEAEAKAAADKAAKDAEMVTKSAMDQAISTATKAATEAAIRTQKEIRNAEKAVRPYVGDLSLAFDSADDVYRHALKTLGVKVDGVHASAFPALLAAQPEPGKRRVERIAQDGAASKGFSDRWPDAQRIGNVG